MPKRAKLIKSISDVCPDFPDWPQRWKITERDVAYGKGITEAFAPFIQRLIGDGRSKKTILIHCTNLWLLGGEIIRHVNLYDDYDVQPARAILASVGPDGGPPCRHIDGDEAARSYDRTCRRLGGFLQR